jgi:hypothetical protein
MAVTGSSPVTLTLRQSCGIPKRSPVGAFESTTRTQECSRRNAWPGRPRLGRADLADNDGAAASHAGARARSFASSRRSYPFSPSLTSLVFPRKTARFSAGFTRGCSWSPGQWRPSGTVRAAGSPLPLRGPPGPGCGGRLDSWWNLAAENDRDSPHLLADRVQAAIYIAAANNDPTFP